MNRHLRRLRDASPDKETALTIGVFDGVHRGHRALVERLVERARAGGRRAVVLTFHPHPDKTLHKRPTRYYLTTPEQRADLLLALGVDLVITLSFDEETRRLSARDFVERLVARLDLVDLWVGSDFALGYQREGTVDHLRKLGKAAGFGVTRVEPIVDESGGAAFSSSRIRELLTCGDVRAAKGQLGRAYALFGPVIHGQQRGRTIGVPTANLALWDEQVVPANGVYAGWALLGGARFMAAINIGIRPTFDDAQLSLEAHLLDFDRDIYGERLEVMFEERLRPERKFDGLDDLVGQIKRDIAATRQLLQGK